MTPFQAFFLYLSLGAFFVGWVFGGHPERRGVMVILIAMILSVVFEEVGSDRVRWAVILIDFGLFVYLAMMALRIDRWWLMLATAMLVLTMVAHAAMFLDPNLSLRVNIATRWVFGVVAVIALALGAVERKLSGEPSVFVTWARSQFKRTA